MNKYEFTLKELVYLLDNNPIDCNCSNADKQIDLERHLRLTLNKASV